MDWIRGVSAGDSTIYMYTGTELGVLTIQEYVVVSS